MSPRQARDVVEQGGLIIDVREPWEHDQGSVPGALLLEHDRLADEIAGRVSDRERKLVVMCAAGERSRRAAAELRQMGYRNVANLDGGFNAWLRAGLESTREQLLDASQRERYLRHLAIAEVGEAGQRRLLDSHVFILGAGGLGSPAALYLAAAGVGRLTIIDGDRVERSNLQRQILHDDELVGRAKTESAVARLQRLNPDIAINAVDRPLDDDNVDAVLEGVDVVIDGSDNFPTRYRLNDACIRHRLPLVYGAVLRFAGQVAVFRAGDGIEPCYRCLFPRPPAPGDAPDCAEAGVLGVLPGVIGTLQATEAIKLLLDIGRPLVSRLLSFDALGGDFRSTRLIRDPECSYCAGGRH